MDIIRGSRHNVGRPSKDHIDEAVYVGAVGARFERPQQMEWEEMIINPEQNTLGDFFLSNIEILRFFYLVK